MICTESASTLTNLGSVSHTYTSLSLLGDDKIYFLDTVPDTQMKKAWIDLKAFDSALVDIVKEFEWILTNLLTLTLAASK